MAALAATGADLARVVRRHPDATHPVVIKEIAALRGSIEEIDAVHTDLARQLGL